MFLIGISGGSGSGKTTLLKRMKERFPEPAVSVISQDDYYLPVDREIENHEFNFDQPSALDLEALFSDIQTLKNGRPIAKKEYTFNNNAKNARVVQIKPAPILIVEGLFVFHHEKIQASLNHLVYIEAQSQIRFNRRLKRDVNERGYSEESIRYKWDKQVEPGFTNFLEPYREIAHTIINSDENLDSGIRQLTELFETVLAQRSAI